MAGRFVLVAPNYHPRTCGVGDHSMRLAQELWRRGHEATVLTREPAQVHPEAPEVPVIGVPGSSPLTLCRRMFQEVSLLRAERVFIQYTPQMLGASRFGSAAVPLLARGLKAQHIPVTLIAHELFLPWSARPDLAVGAALQRLQFAWLLVSADRVVITTSSRLHLASRHLSRSGRPAPLLVPVGPNALPVPRTKGAGRCRIGLFSTLAFGKRFDVVLGAFERIGAVLGSAELVLIGDLAQNEARYGGLLKRIARNRFADRIRLTGKLPLARVSEEVAGLDVFLFPMDTGANTRSGTLPLPLGSAVPVVAARGSETDESFFRSGENILFADSLTEEAFADAAMQLLRDPELARRVGEGGLQLYSRALCWERIVDKLLG
jgi:glycosyltransferase involved in cell wall biosynthesis